MKKILIICMALFVALLTACKATTTEKSLVTTIKEATTTVATNTTTNKETDVTGATTTNELATTIGDVTSSIEGSTTVEATTTTVETDNIRKEGKGSINDPYTIAEIATVLDEMELGVYSTERVYITGICQIAPAAATEFNMYIGDEFSSDVTVLSRKTGLAEEVNLPLKGDEITILGYVNRFESTYYTTTYMFAENGGYTPVIVESNHPDYTIDFDEEGEHYSLVNVPLTQKNGSTIEFNVETEEGYAVKNLKVNGGIIQPQANGGYLLTILGPMTIEVEVTSTAALPILLLKFVFNWDEIKNNGDGVAISDATYELKDETNNKSITLTNLASVYMKAEDALGNDGLKLSTSSKQGSFEFTVSDDIEFVIIRAAKYKTDATKLTINGTENVLVSSSADGLYDEIIVDTTTNKTITISASKRCYISAIECYKNPTNE